MSKMSKAEKYELLIDYLNGEEIDATEDDLIEFVEHEKEIFEKRLAAARASSKKRRDASDELTDQIHSVLTDEPQTIQQILAAVKEVVGDPELNEHRIVPRLARMAKEGRAERSTIDSKGADGSKRSIAAYAKI